LSDRKILEWAKKSGIWQPKAQEGTGSSNDKPGMKFGIPMMDDMSVRRVLMSIAPNLQRSYIVPELEENLLADKRTEALKKFSTSGFKKTATVIMGEPPQEFKDKVAALILAEKQAKADAAKKKKEQEALRNKLLEEKKRKAEEARKAKEAARKKKEGKEEDVEEEKKDPEDEKMEEVAEEPPVELTEEEKKLWFRKLAQADLTDKALTASFARFSLPTKEEGFDGIDFAWASEAAATSFLKDYVLQKKLTSRAEDIKPGDGFKEAWTKWQKTLQEWRKKQAEWKDPAKRKALIAKKKEEAKKKAEEGKEEGAEEPKEPMEINSEDIEVDTVEDICDLGNCEPLFAHFAYEDWTLLSTRFELTLLLHSFKKDLDDADRPSFSPDHLAFYYARYFKKSFNLKNFNCEKFADLAELIKENVSVGEKNSFIQVLQAEDTPVENFVKLTEEHRRERQRRIDAGDETAQIKFVRPAPAQAKQATATGYGRGPAAGNGAPPAAGAKRPYSQPAAPNAYGGAAKQPRTGGYGGGGAGSYGGGGARYGGGSAYGSSYGRR